MHRLGLPDAVCVRNRRGLGVGLALCLMVAWGCGGAGGPTGPTGTLSGKVTYKDQPVPQGSTILFYQVAKGAGASGTIGPDGTYVAATAAGNEIPVGTYAVSVSPPAGPELSPDDAMKLSEEGKLPDSSSKDFPQKYQSSETSGETVEVKEGENTYNLNMTD